MIHAKPVFERRRMHSVLEQAIENEKCGEMLAAGLIEPSLSAMYASNLTFPAKKDAEGGYTDRRMCMDLRAVNDATEFDRYAMPHPDVALEVILGSVIFTILDLRSGYHQIPILETDRDKTSFWWGPKLYRYTRMVMGMKNNTAQFQRLIDFTLASAGLSRCACGYIDDILIHSPSPEQHITDVDDVLGALDKVDLKVHPEKCLVGADMVPYLGHNVSAYGLTPQMAKVEAIRNMAVPTTVALLRAALGCFVYYSGYNPMHSAQAQPLNARLRKEHAAQLVWDKECQNAFDELKANLCKEGLAIKAYDPALPLVLHTDFSNRGLGVVLGQVLVLGGDKEYMVASISRSLNKHERNYSSYQGEMLAVVWACKTLRHYLYGVQFEIVTDHAPLQWLMTARNLTGQHARWALMMQSFSFTMRHRPGAKHLNADALSRLPLPSSADGTGARMDEDEDVPGGLGLGLCNVAQVIEWEGPGPGHALDTGVDLLCGWLVSMAASEALALQSRVVCTVRAAVLAADGGDMDSLAPAWDELLGDCHDRCTAVWDSPADGPRLATSYQQARLRNRAAGWVQAACLPRVAVPAPPNGGALAPCIDTSTLGSDLCADLEEGVCVLELFGGIGAVLEALLHNCVRVVTYLYVDNDTEARQVMAHRLLELHERYPRQLPTSAFTAALTALPPDVCSLTEEHLLEAGATAGVRWVVAAGWPCQDFSPAGRRAGLRGHRAGTYHAMPTLPSLGPMPSGSETGGATGCPPLN